MECYHCQTEIIDTKFFTVLGENFHWLCVRDIVQDYITDQRKREIHTNRLAEAEELGYRKAGDE